ncbi:hypothetical protein PSAB6_680004 [Paraburkholderia sabiae]|nr:hypothetical protein PSAB6_680004 [Paraburkholderia sabiae]
MRRLCRGIKRNKARNKAGLQGRALCHSSGSRASDASIHVILWNGITLLYPKGSGPDDAARSVARHDQRSRRTNVSV